MFTCTLTNDFHNTKTTVRCEALSHFHSEVEILPTANQLKRIRKELCGTTGCTCGGIRGIQRHSDGRRITVNRDAEFAPV